MNFKNWLEMSSLRNLLKDVPQGAIFHPEGPVFKHSRMVRQSLNSAIKIFEQEPLFVDLLPVSNEDRNILRVAAWLHDAGKSSATTWKSPFGEVLPWKDVKHPEGGKWSSVGHEEPEHYEPVLKQLGEPWQGMNHRASAEDRDLVMFLIQKHMGYVGDSASRWFLRMIMDDHGNIRSDRKVKLLIIFKMMDLIGRDTVMLQDAYAFLDVIKKAVIHNRAYWDKEEEKRSPISKKDFIRKLEDKGLSNAQIRVAVKGKFNEE